VSCMLWCPDLRETWILNRVGSRQREQTHVGENHCTKGRKEGRGIVSSHLNRRPSAIKEHRNTQLRGPLEKRMIHFCFFACLRPSHQTYTYNQPTTRLSKAISTNLVKFHPSKKQSRANVMPKPTGPTKRSITTKDLEGTERERERHHLHLISTAGQNILFFLSIFSSKMPSSQAAQTVDPSPLIAKPAVRTPMEGPAIPPTRMRRRTAS
jgi:hypothetical protein